MKLLFDHNISPDLIRRLHDLFPESNHVYHLHLHEVGDSVLWTYARENEFTIVSKDADMSELSMLRAFLRSSFGYGSEIVAPVTLRFSFAQTISQLFN